MDSGGKVTYAAVEGATINANSQQLVNAIDDHSITVKVDATNNKTTTSGNLLSEVLLEEIQLHLLLMEEQRQLLLIKR